MSGQIFWLLYYKWYEFQASIFNATIKQILIEFTLTKHTLSGSEFCDALRMISGLEFYSELHNALRFEVVYGALHMLSGLEFYLVLHNHALRFRFYGVLQPLYGLEFYGVLQMLYGWESSMVNKEI